MLIRALLFLVTLSTLTAVAEPFGPQKDQHVQAELVASVESLRPGETALIGLRLVHDPEWHTYWKITATGYSPSLDWTLPDGFEAGEIQWTVPKPYESLGYVEYVYEDEVLLPVTITVPTDAEPGTEIILRAQAGWLMCTYTTCIPGSVDLAISIRVEDSEPAPNAEWAELFALADRQLPRLSDEVRFDAWLAEDTYFLLVESSGDPLPEELYFFDGQLLIRPTVQQDVEYLDDHRALLRLEADPAGGTSDRFEGVLAAKTGEWAVEGRALAGVSVAVDLADSPPDESFAASLMGGQERPGSSFLVIASLAFLGGLILNLMPCVFPIIGIKIMGFVNQSGSESKSVIAHGLTFTGGVLVSFWILAGFLIALRSGGEQMGWGFQLQSPAFNYILVIIFLLFALNLSGVFEIGQSAMGVGSKLAHKSGYSGTFFSGMLATVVATPCSAPVLGTALGALMAMPPVLQFLAFTAMGLGLALPYLVLSAFPSLIRMFPAAPHRPACSQKSREQPRRACTRAGKPAPGPRTHS